MVTGVGFWSIVGRVRGVGGRIGPGWICPRIEMDKVVSRRIKFQNGVLKFEIIVETEIRWSY